MLKERGKTPHIPCHEGFYSLLRNVYNVHVYKKLPYRVVSVLERNEVGVVLPVFKGGFQVEFSGNRARDRALLKEYTQGKTVHK